MCSKTSLQSLPCTDLDLAFQVCDALEEVLAAGGAVVDYHGCDFFPERSAISAYLTRIAARFRLCQKLCVTTDLAGVQVV